MSKILERFLNWLLSYVKPKGSTMLSLLPTTATDDANQRRRIVETINAILKGQNSVAASQLTGIVANANLPVLHAFKASQTARSSTIAQVADPDLSVAVPGAGTYKLELFLNFGAGTSGAQGFDYAFSYSGTAPNPKTRTFWGVVNAVVVNRATPSVSSLGTTEQNANITTAAAGDWLRISGLMTFTNAGTFALTWAQHSSSANATVLYAASFMSLTKLN